MPNWHMTADVLECIEFFNSQTHLTLSADMKAIGLKRDGRMVASVVYEGFSGPNVWMHVAAEPGARWMTRDYLAECFSYPFKTMGVKRISGYVDEANRQAIRFNEHLGFERETRLVGAAASGGDVIVYVMWQDRCRFLERNHGIKIK